MKNLLWLGPSLVAALLVLALVLHWLYPPAALVVGVVCGLIALILLAYRLDWNGQPLIIPPTTSSGAELAVIFIQGEGIPPARYQPVAEAIQHHCASGRLWVAIPRFLGDSPVPREMPAVVAQAHRYLERQGMSKGAPCLFVAHSVGGIAIQKYLKAFPEQAIGQVLMGSFLGRWNLNQLDPQGRTLIDYPLPTLTIAGTLDGLARISRFAVATWLQRLNAAPQCQPDRFPVVAIEGASHMQFASGEPVPYVKAFDLVPTADEAQVHDRIGALVDAFLPRCLPDQSETASRRLEPEIERSAAWFAPLIDALQMEGYYGFRPACYDTAETNSRTNPCCTPFSPWIQEHANSLMAAAQAAPVPFTITALDSFHRSYTFNPFAKPPVHVPQISSDGVSGRSTHVAVTSVTQALYGVFTLLDTGFFPIAAFSLRCKLNSRQSFWSHGGVSNPQFASTDGPSRAQPINEAVFAWTLANADALSRDRYASLGQPMCMQEDTVRPAVGPLWIWSYPLFRYQPKGDRRVCTISATVMKTPLDYPIAAARGFHYCQLLSPAAAMEWIYIDGLREQASLSGRLFLYGPFAGLDKAGLYFGRSLLRQTRLSALTRR
ncbi:MAG: hypothetical protein EBR33_02220 [Synechococcaceae bacterium WB4_1_0192]|jgi:hypothetical protein|nr:hypothetical protein [Synechococcaceae bacterium WB4_1_0192]